MTTTEHIPEFDVPGESTPGQHIGIAYALCALAGEYFPEFFPRNLDNGVSRAAEASPPQRELAEEDFLRAITEVFGTEGSSAYGGSPGREHSSGTGSFDPPGPLFPLSIPGADTFDVRAVRRDFPILSEKIGDHELIWFDNAATTQKPRCVIERLKRYYEQENSNAHRAAHTLAARATDAYEKARAKAASFIYAPDPAGIVFVRGATEGINLVAHSYGEKCLSPGDEVLITLLEHHANIVPWQMVCRRTGAVLKVAPVDETGQVILSEYARLLGPRTRIVAFTHVSNALGTVTPAAEMAHLAHRQGARVLIDGAQAVAHIPVDVQALGCDFYVFSSHKVFGPMGVGVLYGKAELLEDMGPYQGGGSMIEDVTIEHTRYKRPPHRFEAGTASIADAIALGEALDYVSRLGLHAIAAYEEELLRYGIEALAKVPGLSLIGTAANKAGILSFTLENIPVQAVGEALDREGIAVRAGHHCAQPVLRRYGREDTVRASLALYNTAEEIDRMAYVLDRLVNG